MIFWSAAAIESAEVASSVREANEARQHAASSAAVIGTVRVEVKRDMSAISFVQKPDLRKPTQIKPTESKSTETKPSEAERSEAELIHVGLVDLQAQRQGNDGASDAEFALDAGEF